MENQIVIDFPGATFHAYIARPAKLPAPAVVVPAAIRQPNKAAKVSTRLTGDLLDAHGMV